MDETDPTDLDFTQPPQRTGYNPILARMCFDSHGTEETMAEGGSFFVENQKSDKMYLLIDGEVSLRRGTRSIDVVKREEIFGEMAAITHQPRSASAVARPMPCVPPVTRATRFSRGFCMGISGVLAGFKGWKACYRASRAGG